MKALRADQMEEIRGGDKFTDCVLSMYGGRGWFSVVTIVASVIAPVSTLAGVAIGCALSS